MKDTRTTKIERLAQLLYEGDGSVLVGAASSISCGYLGWAAFLERLEEEVDSSLAAALRERSFLTRADALQDALTNGGDDRFTPIFQQTFHPNRATSDPPAWLSLLFDLGLRHYVTTNYTNELDVVSRRHGFQSAIRWHEKGTLDLLRGIGRRVLHLHGRYDDLPVTRDGRTQIVLGERSYQDAYFTGRVADIIRTLLKSSTLLIVGASLDDEDIRSTLRGVATVADSTDAYHYVIHELWPEGHPRYRDPESLEQDLLARYRLQPIFFEVAIDQGSPVFDELHHVIRQLVDAVKRRRGEAAAPGGRDSAHDASLAWALTRLLPSPRDFRQVAAGIGVDATPSVLRRSPMDRWYSLVGQARRTRSIEKLRDVAKARIPRRRAPELGSSSIQPQPIDRANVEEFFAGSPEGRYFGPLSAAAAERSSAREDLGALAFYQYWGKEPDHPQVDAWRQSLRDRDVRVFEKAVEEGKIKPDGWFVDRDMGLAVAADFIVRRCEEDDGVGEDLMAWVLPRLADCDAFRYEILVHVLAWWPGASSLVTRFLEGGLVPPAGSSVDQLLALTFTERLQRDADLMPSVMQVPIPVSVQWAKQAGLDGFVASVLEVLGEDRLEIYLEQWRGAKGPARTALARAIRRCAIKQGVPVGDALLDRAIEATLPETTVARILKVIENPRVLNLWLDLLPLDPNEAQVTALGERLVGARWGGERTAFRCAERLSQHPDLVLVWKSLGERRRPWIEKLEPQRLPELACKALLEDLQRRTLTREEAADFDRLAARLREGVG